MSEMTFSVRLKADGSGLIGEVKIAKSEFDKLANATKKSGAAAEKTSKDVSHLGKETKKSGDSADKAASDVARFSRKTKQAGDSAKRFNGIQKNLMRTLISAGAAYLSFRGAADAVAAYKVQEQAVAALDQSIKSMGRTTEGLSGQLQSLASEIQSKGIIGDEALIKGQSFLATYGKITDDLLPRTTRIMADVAAKMGGDTVQAANLLGKASMGMTGELSRMGITLSEEAKKTKDFGLILTEIEAQVGGMNAALRDTSTGGLDAFGNDVGDINEGIGELVIGIVDGMMPSLNIMTKNIKDNVLPGLGDWLESIGLIKRSLNDLSLKQLRLKRDRLLSDRTKASREVRSKGRDSGGPLGIAPINNSQLDERKARLVEISAELEKINQQMFALQSKPKPSITAKTGGTSAGGSNNTPAGAGATAPPIDAGKKYIDYLNQQTLALQLNETQMLRHKSVAEAAKATTQAQSDEILAATDRLILQKQSVEAKVTADKKAQEITKEGIRLTQAMQTPLESYAVKIKHITDLQNSAAISSETMGRAGLAAMNELNNSIQSSGDPLQDYEDKVGRITAAFQGGDLGGGAAGEGNYFTALGQAQDEFILATEVAAIQWSDIWDSAQNTFSQGVGNAVAGVIVDQENIGKSMGKVMKNVAKQVIAALVKIGVQQLIMSAFAKKSLTSSVAAAEDAGASMATSYSASATLASLSSYGANSVPAMAGMAATFAVAEGITLAGVAHDGLDVVPTDGTYLLQGGERIVKKEDNKKLTQALNNGGSSGGVQITQHIHLSAIDTENIDRWIFNRADVFKALAVEGVQDAFDAAGQDGILT